MDSLFSQLQNIAMQIRTSIPTALWLLGILWVVWFVNFLVGYRLSIFGIYPRRLFGIPGIFLHPFLHGSFNHLFFNSIPLFVLLTFILVTGVHQFLCVTLSIIILSGIGIWLFGRRAIHIGASALIMGYWGYLLVNAYYHPSILSYVLAIVCFYYFGSLILSVFPTEERTSWEGHLFGLLAGVATTFICPLMLLTPT